MAVDSRQKRMSMMTFGSSMVFMPMFEADSSVDADDRAHQLSLYSGVTLSAPSSGDNSTFYYYGLYAGDTM